MFQGWSKPDDTSFFDGVKNLNPNPSIETGIFPQAHPNQYQHVTSITRKNAISTATNQKNQSELCVSALLFWTA